MITSKRKVEEVMREASNVPQSADRSPSGGSVAEPQQATPAAENGNIGFTFNAEFIHALWLGFELRMFIHKGQNSSSAIHYLLELVKFIPEVLVDPMCATMEKIEQNGKKAAGIPGDMDDRDIRMFFALFNHIIQNASGLIGNWIRCGSWLGMLQRELERSDRDHFGRLSNAIALIPTEIVQELPILRWLSEFPRQIEFEQFRQAWYSYKPRCTERPAEPDLSRDLVAEIASELAHHPIMVRGEVSLSSNQTAGSDSSRMVVDRCAHRVTLDGIQYSVTDDECLIFWFFVEFSGYLRAV